MRLTRNRTWLELDEGDNESPSLSLDFDSLSSVSSSSDCSSSDSSKSCTPFLITSEAAASFPAFAAALSSFFLRFSSTLCIS